MAQSNVLSPHATTISHDYVTGETIVTYHKTQICRINKDAGAYWVTLGSWDTVTTRRKLNQCSLMWGLGFKVYRDKGVTYFEAKGDSPKPMETGLVYGRLIP